MEMGALCSSTTAALRVFVWQCCSRISSTTHLHPFVLFFWFYFLVHPISFIVIYTHQRYMSDGKVEHVACEDVSLNKPFFHLHFDIIKPI